VKVLVIDVGGTHVKLGVSALGAEPIETLDGALASRNFRGLHAHRIVAEQRREALLAPAFFDQRDVSLSDLIGVHQVGAQNCSPS
jgi:hypothetical protein